MLSAKSILLTGAVMGGLAVALGAFGAHALKPLLLENNAVDIYTLGAQYQFYHALLLLVIGILADRNENIKTALAWAAGLILGGILLFSGSLYILALTGSRSVVLLTPIGGLFFLAGWLALILAIAKKARG